MRGRILIIYGILVWRNDIKCKYMFMFPLKNLARKELLLIERQLHKSPNYNANVLHYAHRSLFVVLCCGFEMVDFTHIIQDCFTGTGAII